MESDEFETINSIENWLAAPLDAETQPLKTLNVSQLPGMADLTKPSVLVT